MRSNNGNRKMGANLMLVNVFMELWRFIGHGEIIKDSRITKISWETCMAITKMHCLKIYVASYIRNSYRSEYVLYTIFKDLNDVQLNPW